MSVPAEVLKLRLHSRRLPEQLDHARSNELGSMSPRSLFNRELDDMSDGSSRELVFRSALTAYSKQLTSPPLWINMKRILPHHRGANERRHIRSSA